MIIEINNKTRSNISEKTVRKVVEKFLEKNRKTGKEVSIVFVGDKAIRRINKEFRGKDKVTDVLSFEGEENFLGEILIDYAQIRRQAKKFGNSAKDELVFILVHGLLHLIGHEDETEKGRKKMERLGEDFIKRNPEI